MPALRVGYPQGLSAQSTDMNKKLKCILLIDDNDADNELHQIAIDRLGCAENIQVAHDGQEALGLLQNPGECSELDLIFLDINMPGMNGWEFLEEYKSLAQEQKARALVLMLSASPGSGDKEKSESFEDVSGLIEKPIRAKNLEEVLKKHFADLF